MKKSEMKCSTCEYFQATQLRTFRGLNIVVDGECRHDPPSMLASKVTETSMTRVFEDSGSFQVPICYDTFVPVYPLVYSENWCGQGRWVTPDGRVTAWGQWEPD